MRKNIYNALFVSNVNYLINIWGNTTQSNINKLQRQQNKILKTLYNLPHRTPTVEVLRVTNEISIKQRITLNNMLLLHKIDRKCIKTSLVLKRTMGVHNYYTRCRQDFRTQRYRTKRYTMKLTTETINMYNKLPNNIKKTELPDLQTKTTTHA